MILCNNAFVDLARRIEDILSASFNEVPKGDKERVGKVADNLLMLLINSYYSLTWINSRYYRVKNPDVEIDFGDTEAIARIA
jgi:hypothetical protein